MRSRAWIGSLALAGGVAAAAFQAALPASAQVESVAKTGQQASPGSEGTEARHARYRPAWVPAGYGERPEEAAERSGHSSRMTRWLAMEKGRPKAMLFIESVTGEAFDIGRDEQSFGWSERQKVRGFDGLYAKTSTQGDGIVLYRWSPSENVVVTVGARGAVSEAELRRFLDSVQEEGK